MTLLVYPFSKEYSVFTRYSHLLQDYSRVVPVAIKGSGLDGKDAGVCDGGSNLHVVIGSDFEGALGSVDAVFLGYQGNIKDDNYIGKVDKALSENKKLYIESELLSIVSEEIKGRPYTVLSFSDITLDEDHNSALYTVQVPIILVAGVGENCDKFHVQLGIKDALETSGYKVAQWGTKEYSSLFGIEPLPQYLFELIPTGEKVLSFNHHVYDRTTREKADVVVLGIPGGIMQVNPYVFSDFGEYAFIIGNSVKADTGVLCTYAGEINEELIDKLYSSCVHRINMTPKFINMATTSITVTSEKKKSEFSTVPISYIHNKVIPKVGKYAGSLFCAMDYDSMSRAASGLIDLLKENI